MHERFLARCLSSTQEPSSCPIPVSRFRGGGTGTRAYRHAPSRRQIRPSPPSRPWFPSASAASPSKRVCSHSEIPACHGMLARRKQDAHLCQARALATDSVLGKVAFGPREARVGVLTRAFPRCRACSERVRAAVLPFSSTFLLQNEQRDEPAPKAAADSCAADRPLSATAGLCPRRACDAACARPWG